MVARSITSDHWGSQAAWPTTSTKKSEASYTVLQVTCTPELVQEMDRLMSIDEKIVRTKVLRLEK